MEGILAPGVFMEYKKNWRKLRTMSKSSLIRKEKGTVVALVWGKQQYTVGAEMRAEGKSKDKKFRMQASKTAPRPSARKQIQLLKAIL